MVTVDTLVLVVFPLVVEELLDLVLKLRIHGLPTVHLLDQAHEKG